MALQALFAVLVTLYNSGDFLVFLGYKLAQKCNPGLYILLISISGISTCEQVFLSEFISLGFNCHNSDGKTLTLVCSCQQIVFRLYD